MKYIIPTNYILLCFQSIKFTKMAIWWNVVLGGKCKYVFTSSRVLPSQISLCAAGVLNINPQYDGISLLLKHKYGSAINCVVHLPILRQLWNISSISQHIVNDCIIIKNRPGDYVNCWHSCKLLYDIKQHHGFSISLEIPIIILNITSLSIYNHICHPI